MGKCIEIDAMKPVEIDHVLHAGKMVPRRWDGGAENQGAVTRKGGRLFCCQRGGSYSKCRTANLFCVCYA